MKKQILLFILFALLVTGCTKDITPDLSNKDRMNQLEISDPLVWNSLTRQFIELDTTGSGLKAGNGLKAMREYPSSDKYYYALFEDLYPYQGDYDFNDIMLETKLFLDSKKSEFWGSLKSTLINRGGSLKTRLGLMFYAYDGKNGYTRIDNSQILVNGNRLEGKEPYTMELPAEGAGFSTEFYVQQGLVPVKYIWITWFLVVDSDGESREIHSSGFPVSTMETFQIPQRDFLTGNNLPWGLEIEAEEFFIPVERTLFLDAFPEFRDWAESKGSKNSSWFRNPDRKRVK